MTSYKTEPSPPADEAGVTAEEFPLKSLPPLPDRGNGYHSEPIVGTCLVLGICAVLIGLCVHTAIQTKGVVNYSKVTVAMVLLWSCVAVSCILHLMFGDPPDEIKRSHATCYPMPVEVVERLRSGRTTPLPGGNFEGPPNSTTLGSYCVRCLVWRPPLKTEAGRAHHCNVCQRCVVGFDHHCNLFGRCITRGNLPTFYLLVAMLPIGVLTALVPLVITETTV
eukprot:TRINITY_DN7333_c0_g1_i1.p1 TRINITY_DN7333_c0_g1~~TRINITY_DN7333_c0_g1_i1.p1  ORF type:complete len:222 (+),score=29.52 TRINITY_DN7333_c0_g1_i1:189-854(+)